MAFQWKKRVELNGNRAKVREVGIRRKREISPKSYFLLTFILSEIGISASRFSNFLVIFSKKSEI